MTKILSIDTSCDETAAAVTDGTRVLSNVIWSQASLHAKWGGVYPSLAKRAHEERIDWVVEKALKKAFPKFSIFNGSTSSPSRAKSRDFQLSNIDAVAVTIGPGLAITLEVGIKKAKEISQKFNKPLIPVNHVEGHLLSPMATPRTGISNFKFLISKQIPNYKIQILNKPQVFPALSLVASGKHTDLIYVKNIGDYHLVAHTIDDALGEALDKAARMLGLGYPGGAILEKMAKDGNPNSYPLPIPMAGREKNFEFSYSGLKTAMYRLVEKEMPLDRIKIQNLASSFQNTAFRHVERITERAIDKYPVKNFLFGGGVSANIELRKRLRYICKKRNIKLSIPYSKNLCTDNAAMIGIAATFKYLNKEFLKPDEVDVVERIPRAKVYEKFTWENKFSK